MKKVIALFLLIVMAFAGCLTDSGDDKKDDNNGTNGNGGTFKISGKVVLGSVEGSGLSGVKMTLTGTSTNLTVNSDNNGNYTFSNLANGSYNVTPSKTGYTFSETNVAVTVADKDVIVVTFIATQTGDNNNGNGGTSNYTPFKLNATWTYDSLFDDILSEEYTNTVKGTKNIGGKTYWMMVSDNFDGTETYSDTTYFRVSNNVVYSFYDDIVMNIAKPANAAKLAPILKALKVSESEVPMIKFGVAAGTTWAIYQDSGSYQNTSYSYDLKGKYVGTEAVQVTAGSFPNCAKFELTIDISSTYNDQTYSSNSVITMWFAPNVGVVKNVDVITASIDTMNETYTITDNLKSYNIP